MTGLSREDEGGNSIRLHGYPGHSPKRRVRPAPLPSPFVNAHPNLKQPRTVRLHKAQFVDVVDVWPAQQELRVPLGRELARKVEQPHELPLRNLDRGLAHDRAQFGGDAREYARRREHAEMRDAQRAVRMFRV